MEEIRKHLRNSMLALLLVIGSFLLVASLPSASLYEKAIEEAKTIQLISARWAELGAAGLVEEWVRQRPELLSRSKPLEARLEYSLSVPEDVYEKVPELNDENGLRFRFLPDKDFYTPIDSQGERLAVPVIIAGAHPGTIQKLARPISRLDQFKELWNLLPAMSEIIVVTGFGDPIDSYLSFEGRTKRISEISGTTQKITVTEGEFFPGGLRLVDARDKVYRGVYRFDVIDGANSAKVRSLRSGRIPIVHVEQTSPQGQTNYYGMVSLEFEEYDAKFQEQISNQDYLPDKSFESSFGNIAEVIEDFEGFTLSDLDAFVDLVAELNAESARVFGLDIPQRLVFVWGCLIIFICHIYFLVHLERYAAAGSYEDLGESGWIGDYPSTLARIVATATTVVIPIAAVVFLNVRLLVSDYRLWQAIASLTGSFFLVISCCYCFFLFRRLWRRERSLASAGARPAVGEGSQSQPHA